MLLIIIIKKKIDSKPQKPPVVVVPRKKVAIPLAKKLKSSSASAPLSRKVINPPPVLNYIHNYPISRPKSIYEIRIGQYVTGYVHNIQEFGIFIDFGEHILAQDSPNKIFHLLIISE